MIERDALFYDAIDLLKALIAIPSLSREETNAADYLAAYLEKKHCKVYRKGNNVWCYSEEYNPKKPTILLNSHIDTVKPAASWTKDPYAPIEEDDKLYGLGSNDAGASVVSLLHTFLFLKERKQPYNLIFLASAEEEVSGANGIESVIPDLAHVRFAIVGEPTKMQPAVAEKGLMVLDCIAKGKSGHAARNEGVNAITEAIKDIEWFNSYQFAETSPLLGPVKMTVTMIHAGTQHNVIPDRCEFTVDIRSNEYYSNQELYNIIGKHVKAEVKARSFRLNSSRTPDEHPFVERAEMLGLVPFGSPTLSDQALMPFPSVKIGPGDSSRSHTADEYIKPSEIREAIDLYIKLLDGLVIK